MAQTEALFKNGPHPGGHDAVDAEEEQQRKAHDSLPRGRRVPRNDQTVERLGVCPPRQQQGDGPKQAEAEHGQRQTRPAPAAKAPEKLP